MPATMEDLNMQVDRILQAAPARRHISGFSIEPDVDHDGDPIVRVVFKLASRRPRINDLARLASDVGVAINGIDERYSTIRFS